MKKVLHHYNSDHLPISAQEIVPIIMDKINPFSVVDVGCGLAQWLKVFENHGIKEVLGIDGEHVSLDNIYIDKIYDNFTKKINNLHNDHKRIIILDNIINERKKNYMDITEDIVIINHKL